MPGLCGKGGSEMRQAADKKNAGRRNSELAISNVTESECDERLFPCCSSTDLGEFERCVISRGRQQGRVEIPSGVHLS